MIRTGLVVAFAAALLCSPPASAGTFTATGIPASGVAKSIIFRDGEPIGTDVSEFIRDGDRLTVRTRTHIAVEVLLVTVYRLDMEVEEQWVDGRLVALRTRADDNGTKRLVELRGDDDVAPALLRVSTGSGASTVPAGILPSGFWNPATVEHREFVDTMTGKRLEVSIAPRGQETVEIAGRQVQALRYEMRGDLARDLWYGLDGQLLKLEFEAQDGSRITQLRTLP